MLNKYKNEHDSLVKKECVSSLGRKRNEEASKIIRERATTAREIQTQRFTKSETKTKSIIALAKS